MIDEFINNGIKNKSLYENLSQSISCQSIEGDES